MQKPVKRFLSGIMSAAIAFSCLTGVSISSYAADPDYKSWTQMDSRWGSKTLGSGYASVSQYGCLATSIAILAVHSGAVTSDSFNPGTFVDSMNALGGFDYSGSLVSWDLISDAVPGLECAGKLKIPYDTTESEYIEELKQLENEGYYSICYVGNHWVLVDYIEGDNVYMCDPGSSSTDMLSEYPFDSYTHDTIRYFKCSNGSAEPAQNPTDNNSDNIYEVTASSLNLRTSPSTDSDSVELIPQGEKITVTEISEGWGKTSYNGQEGWIYMEYAKRINAETTTAPTETTDNQTVTTVSGEKEYRVTSKTADVTEYSENGSDILCTIPENAVVKVKSTVGDYAEILFGDSTAFIALKDIAPVPDNESAPEKGDVNGDGYVDKQDIAMLNEYILTESSLPENISAFTCNGRFAADLSSDGAVDNEDVIQLLILIRNN